MSIAYAIGQSPWCANCRALPRSTILGIVCVSALLGAAHSTLFAQGITTARIQGVVRASDGGDADGVRVTVVNASTAFTVRTEVRHGRFVADGLEVGGPYIVTLLGLGFYPKRYDGIVLSLGESRELHIVMQSVATTLDTVHAIPTSRWADVQQGPTTIIADPLLHDLPTLNRNVYDFVELSPQVSTKIGFAAGGMSGGGAGFRYNDFLLNGVSQRSVSGHVPPEFSGAESVPFDAVREYRIFVAPFDVRYGDFVGALVDAVTRSGTNQFEGSLFSYWRSDGLARRSADASSTPYDRRQSGFSLGGPLRRDRMHFFVAADLQRFSSPAPGPYLGQSVSSAQPVPVSASDVARLQQILSGYGLVAGSAGPVENKNPLSSLFARLDMALPERSSRAILWMNETQARSVNFSRSALAVFPLSSSAATQTTGVQSAALQLHTDFRRTGGGHNELLVSRYRAGSAAHSDVRQPVVVVEMPSTIGGAVSVVTGTPTQAQGASLDGQSIEVQDDVTLPLGAWHVLTVGLTAAQFRAARSGVTNAYGRWSFASLDSLAERVPESFTLDRDFGSGNVPVAGGQYALYAGDQWQPSERVSITTGMRVDLLTVSGHAPYNATVDSIFGRRTDVMPRRRAEFSPRLGFSWNLSASGRDRLRGGVGMFTVRPPVAWLHAPLYSYGVGIGTLSCGRLPSDLGPPPSFTPDYRAPPLGCANGANLTATPRGNVDLLDHGLRMAQTLRGALSYDRQLPWDLAGSVEALLTRTLADFAFANLNLSGPRAVDRNGRVLYGTIGAGGIGAPALRSNFSEVIDLENISQNHAAQLSAQLEKHFGQSIRAMASYTFSRVRDAETPLRVNTSGTDNWASRAVSGRQDDLRPGISLNDIPHRVVFVGTKRVPRRRWPTELSLYYVGESGSPFTYLAWGAVRGRGDLNADGSNTNDPIYIPRSALDTNEIRFAPFTRQVSGSGGAIR
ncbi:MAG TPA: carboxypeptidase regulatory-like domain-containing protein, partial [Gemmatimonadaceae bacterium]|nr:carboxypeptidase regulatory-like domain-containing protein [Gemmatimonadaceae bacterium]